MTMAEELEQLKDKAADLHAAQQAMPDPGALQAHRDIVQEAYELGFADGLEAAADDARLR